jgi:hypothetical protein
MAFDDSGSIFGMTALFGDDIDRSSNEGAREWSKG